MKGQAERFGIDCPIALFAKQEAEIVGLTAAINQARTAPGKAPAAEALARAVDVLLACEHYDENDLNCRLCRDFSALRHKTATLILKAARYG